MKARPPKSGYRERRDAFRKHWSPGITYAEMQKILGGSVTIDTIGRYARELQMPLKKKLAGPRRPRPAVVGDDNVVAFRASMAVRDARFLERLGSVYGKREVARHG